MRLPVVRFLLKVAALAALLGTLLLADAFILGNLSLFGALALMPAAAIGTVRLFRLSVRPAHKRNRHTVGGPPHHPADAQPRPALASSQLRVYGCDGRQGRAA